MTAHIIHHAVRKFLKSLPPDLKNKTVEQLDALETFGRLLPPPDSKKINADLFELRIQGTIQVRLLYGFKGNAVYIVNGFIKKSNKLPQRELKTARARFRGLA